ncbi:hypothetical protein NAEX_01324 [Nannocystis exedens]|nr:hypothetical protein NAEX_01324 [Nannocystis exedens]
MPMYQGLRLAVTWRCHEPGGGEQIEHALKNMPFGTCP